MGTRIRRSFNESIGSIVFGMEDGTVSIFGLVFGVAASAPDSHAVLLAGATGAAAAAVSMMSGAFLDAKTANDQDAVKLAELRERLDRDSEAENMATRTRLLGEGYSDTDADTLLRLVGRHPESQLRITAAVTLGISNRTWQSPLAQAAWMFVADLIAASVPVIPFALFGLNTARLVSVVITLLLLVLLGVGRAMMAGPRSWPPC